MSSDLGSGLGSNSSAPSAILRPRRHRSTRTMGPAGRKKANPSSCPRTHPPSRTGRKLLPSSVARRLSTPWPWRSPRWKNPSKTAPFG